MKRVAFIGLLVLMACSNPKREMTGKVKELEKEMENKFDPKRAKELITSYDSYIQKYPDDSTSRIYMAKAAEMSILDNNPDNALKYINMFLQKYPNDKRAGYMQFKKAMVYDLLVHDALRAVAEYDIFIQKYPNDPMREDAINAILLINNPAAFMSNLGAKSDSSYTSGPK